MHRTGGSRTLRLLAVLVVLVVGTVATLIAGGSARDRADEADEAAFGDVVDRVHQRLAGELGRYEDLLLASAGSVLIGSDAASFSEFIDGVELGNRYPGAYGLAYIERILGPPERALLRYVEPPAPTDVRGVDLLAIDEVRLALAVDVEGRARLTPRLRSLEAAIGLEERDGGLLALFAPVGDPTAPQGWVGLPLVAGEFAQWLGRDDGDVAQIDLFDGLVPDEATRLTSDAERGPVLRRDQTPHEVFGRTWTVVVRQVAQAAPDASTGPVMATGAVATALVAIAVWIAVNALVRQRRTVDSLAYRAAHDELTGLANRVLLREWLTERLELVRTSGRSVALLYCDLDRFKVANDSLGHTAGDQLLVQVADRFTRSVRDGDVVARLGGDEFAVACEVSHPGEARAVAERMRQSLLEPFDLGGHEVFLTASIGVSVADRGDVEQLLVEADSAMYEAKDRGRAQISAGSTRVRSEVREQLQLEGALHRAIQRGEMRLHYQPVVDMTTGTSVGTEALLRWDHPTLGLLLPDRFIRLAEETGLIVPLGNWVLETACADWAADGRDGSLAVNLSARQLLDADVVDSVSGVLHRTGLAPERLTLEVTESVLLTEVAAAQAAVLRGLGVRVAVDDFGTGYSSLALLRELPADVLKVDRSFVARMGGDRMTDAIVAAIVGLADALELELIAEGVETPAQAEALLRVGCRFGQGYLFGRPEPIGAALEVDLLTT